LASILADPIRNKVGVILLLWSVFVLWMGRSAVPDFFSDGIPAFFDEFPDFWNELGLYEWMFRDWVGRFLIVAGHILLLGASGLLLGWNSVSLARFPKERVAPWLIVSGVMVSFVSAILGAVWLGFGRPF
jgi:hypothetical protein